MSEVGGGGGGGGGGVKWEQKTSVCPAGEQTS